MRAVRISQENIQKATSVIPEADRYEMAVLSYCHRNPLIRWLFWKRLDAALSLAQLKPGENVFEFGVGSGILLPSFQEREVRIAGTDLHILPAVTMSRMFQIPSELVPLEAFSDWVRRNKGAFDCIFALDVLEHVEEEALQTLSEQFRLLLSPKGRLILSGPTETFFYKVGRWVAGFKGDYHHRNIFDIVESLNRSWKTEQSVYLPFRPLPRAFLISCLAPRSQ